MGARKTKARNPRATAPSPPAPHASGVRTSPAAGPLVLVVDDLRDNREMYVEYLEFCGFAVISAQDGHEAIALARKFEPAVIVMDISLPLLDGLEATRAIRRDPATADIRIIALTGHVEPQYRARALRAGCDAFIPKPCLPEDLASHVRAAFATPKKK